MGSISLVPRLSRCGAPFALVIELSPVLTALTARTLEVTLLLDRY
jgi:hypothetical protein